MGADEVEQVLPGWQAASAEVAGEVAAWRTAHPSATLDEIEEAVVATVQRLQARFLGQVVQASPTANLASAAPTEQPVCPECGGRLQPRGRQRRTVLPARAGGAALELERSYAVCLACGAGLFPPG